MAKDDEVLSGVTDAPETNLDAPEESEDAADQVRARVVSPMNGHFIPGDDLPEVPVEGVVVSRDVADRIKAKAKDAGVTISARKE